MANYSSKLKSWGSTGSEYPNGYSYAEGEQPVDAWDNFVTHHIINDLSHLVSLTNDRLESDSGTSHPMSPETGHLSHRSDTETLSVYDSTAAKWREVFFSDGSRPMTGVLDMNNYGISGLGDLTDKNGNTIFDATAGHVPASMVQSSGLDADTVDGKHASELGSGVSEEGTAVYSATTDINFTGHLDVIDDADGTVTIDPTHNHDNQYVNVSGDTMGGPIDMSGNAIADSSGTPLALNGDVSIDGSPVQYKWFSKQEGGTVGSSSFVPIGTFGLANGETLYVTQAMLTADGFTTPCVAGIDLVIAPEGAVDSTDTLLIAGGDGTTHYDDITGSPIVSYNNSSGAHQTVTIGIDNGHYNAGTGTDEGVYAGYIARVN